jgi:4-hydroxybenzoate polyprenyltransferase
VVIKKISRILVYSNLFIGLCAAAMVAVTQVWYGQLETGYFYMGFVFFGTILHYGLHRMVGLNRIAEPTGRFIQVQEMSSITFFSMVLSGLGALICFSQLSWETMTRLIFPIILALLYITPVFGNGRRLRDLPYIKILVIALVWSWTTFYVPMMSESNFNYLDGGLMFERFIFLLAITLPFDVRDMEVDSAQGQKTLATLWGISNTKRVAQILLFAGVLSMVSICLEHPPFQLFALAYLPGYLLAYMLIIGVKEGRPDSYYSIGLDGTMLLLGLSTVITYLFLQ